jgi:hypothetical protein
LTEQKTAKPAMLDAGLPTEALGEADVWTSSEHPRDLPGFEDLSKARQQTAINEWEKANAAWADFENPAPGSKTERLKECIGQRATVPLDSTPNGQGIQRFVTAEYEVKEVEEGAAKAKLIRVKYYEVTVKDVNTGQTLNSKVVVDSPTALPQTPDADAMALGKVVGTNADGTPKIAALDRAEREFVYQRYIDKNIKARRSGSVPGLSEHGATMNLDDAGSLAAGQADPTIWSHLPTGEHRLLLPPADRPVRQTGGGDNRADVPEDARHRPLRRRLRPEGRSRHLGLALLRRSPFQQLVGATARALFAQNDSRGRMRLGGWFCSDRGGAVMDLAVRILRVRSADRLDVPVVVPEPAGVGHRQRTEFEQGQTHVRRPLAGALAELAGEERCGRERHCPDSIERQVDLVRDQLRDPQGVVGQRAVAGVDRPGETHLSRRAGLAHSQ